MSSLPDNAPSRLQALREAIELGRLEALRRSLLSMSPAEIALLLESLPPAEREVLWRTMDIDDGGEVLVHVGDEVRARLIEMTEADELLAAADSLEFDDLADIISDLPDAVTERLLQSMDAQDRERLHQVMAHPEDTAGGLMNTDTVTVRASVTIAIVRRYLRIRGEIPEATDRLFVVNRYGYYLGTLAITKLLTAEDEARVAEVMDTSEAAIGVDATAHDVARLFADRDLVSAAVIDEEGRLLGRITIDDVVDVISDQADHSMMSMAGLDEDEDLFAPVRTSAYRRAVWLGVNLGTAFLAAAVVSLFGATIEQVVALAVLMPVVACMGGIAGSQTLTLIIRALALGQIEDSNARLILAREVAVGSLNGLAWSAVVAGIAMLWFHSWQLGAVIAVAMLLNLVTAALAGVAVPLAMKRLGIDPALAGSVVLTTITDVVGFMTFLGLGAAFLV
jgi:magnesium transporter